MKYWIIIDNVQRGPMSLDELAAIRGLSASTPVWHEGLADWTVMGAVPELAAMLAASANQQQAYGQQQGPYGQQAWNNPQQPYAQRNPYGGWQQNPYNGQQAAYGQPQQPYGQQPNDMQPQMPDNYLVWAIIATICCCLPTGVVAIIYAAKVSPAYMRGDYTAALDASSKAQMWVIVSFVAGLIWAPFSVLLSLL